MFATSATGYSKVGFIFINVLWTPLFLNINMKYTFKKASADKNAIITFAFQTLHYITYLYHPKNVKWWGVWNANAQIAFLSAGALQTNLNVLIQWRKLIQMLWFRYTTVTTVSIQLVYFRPINVIVMRNITTNVNTVSSRMLINQDMSTTYTLCMGINQRESLECECCIKITCMNSVPRKS